MKKNNTVLSQQSHISKVLTHSEYKELNKVNFMRTFLSHFFSVVECVPLTPARPLTCPAEVKGLIVNTFLSIFTNIMFAFFVKCVNIYYNEFNSGQMA